MLSGVSSATVSPLTRTRDIAIQRRLRLRRLWLNVHLYLGLTLGTLLAMLGLTGTVIGFWEEIYEWADPALVVPKAPAGYVSVERVMENLRAAHPQRSKSWELWLPRTPQSVIYVNYSGPEEKGAAYAATLIIAVNPNSGELIKTWYWGETVITWLYNLHAFLALGVPGENLVGFAGLLSLASLCTGLYLWWPPGPMGRTAFLPAGHGGAARLEYDVHRLVGLYTLVIMMVISVTGAMLVFPRQFGDVIGVFSPIQELHPHVRSTPRPGAAAIPLSAAVDVAMAAFPDAEVKRVYTPGDTGDTFRVVLRQDAETFNRSHPYTQAWVDQYSGTVLRTTDPAHFTPGTALLSYRLAFHNGEAFGLPGRLLVSVFGAVLASLWLTGMLQWWRRRRIRRLRDQAVSP